MTRAGAVAIALLLACDREAVATLDTPREGPTCGDGIVDADEACDLGFANRADGPCRGCRLPACGDGIVDVPLEQCDDGNADEDDACKSDCTATLPRTWERTFDAGIDDERIADVALADDGDIFVAGRRDAGLGTPPRIWAARLAPSGETRWNVDLPADGRAATGARLALRDDEVVVVGTVLDLDGVPVEPWVATVADDGTILHEGSVGSFGAEARAVAATSDRTVLALASADGRGLVLALDDAGATTWEHTRAAPPPVDARGVAITDDGDVIAGGSSRGGLDGWVDRLAPDGALRWAFGDAEGPVESIALDGASAIAAVTERIEADDPAMPLNWTTGVRVLELDEGGAVRWSESLAPDQGRREAGAIAIGEHEVVVVGSDPRGRGPCSDLWCPARPWIAVLQRGGGSPRLVFDFAAIDQGRARAVAIDAQARVVVGGDVQRLFARPDAWLSVHDGALP